MFEVSKYAKVFEQVLGGAIQANEAQTFSNLNDKLSNLKQIVINLTEAKEEELCNDKIASIKEKHVLLKEIKTRCQVAEAKVKFYKKFQEILESMKEAYDRVEKK